MSYLTGRKQGFVKLIENIKITKDTELNKTKIKHRQGFVKIIENIEITKETELNKTKIKHNWAFESRCNRHSLVRHKSIFG